MCLLYFGVTRTTHAHDASRRIVPVCLAHADRPCGAEIRAQESSMKREHNLYLACEDSPQRGFIFNFLLFSSCPLSFYCTLTSLLSLSQCRQPSAAFSTRLHKTRTLRRTSRVVLPFLDCQEAPFFPVLGKACNCKRIR